MFHKIKALSKDLAIYGLGDVATSIVGFLLLPVFTRYLSPTEYGVLTLLVSVETMAKIVYRWGLDGSFMRFYYDCPDEPARQRMASTIFLYLLVVDGTLVGLAMLAAPLAAETLFGTGEHTLSLRLVLLNTFILGFNFIPFHVLRILGRSKQFSVLTFARSASTLALKVILVVWLGMGVLGVVLADVVVSVVITLVLARYFTALVRPVFSRVLLRDALRFGLPRLPHGLAQQLMVVGDRYILRAFLTLGDVGLYSIGVTFGMTLKYFLSAFEYAWAPFYYATAREAAARRVFSTVTTYGVALLALLAATLSAVGFDVLRLMTQPEYWGAVGVIPWIALGVSFQGVYLLTSIGLNLTKHTEYYPVSTALAAATSVGANLLLVPRFGIVGAAWANTAAYAVLAATAFRFSQRFYAVHYEWARLLRIVVAAGVAYAAAVWLVPPLSPLGGLLARASVVVVLYVGLLWMSGFFHAHEIAALRRVARRTEPHGGLSSTPETSGLAGAILDVSVPDDMAEPELAPSFGENSARRAPVTGEEAR